MHALVVQAVQPLLGTVAALKKIKVAKYLRDVDNTVNSIRRLTLELIYKPPKRKQSATFFLP